MARVKGKRPGAKVARRVARRWRPGEPLPPGWEIVTEADLEQLRKVAERDRVRRYRAQLSSAEREAQRVRNREAMRARRAAARVASRHALPPGSKSSDA